MGSTNSKLPDSKSSSLCLAHPTDQENNTIWKSTADEWRDALPVNTYLEESVHLMTVPLARDGGMTQWVLVDGNLPPNKRPILASCETFRKRSWISGSAGNATEVVTHGVASVYVNKNFRNRGYASRLMTELGNTLPTWQVEETRCVASVLFSDIGKEYYSRMRWHAFPSFHLEFAPLSSTTAWTQATRLYAEDLRQLCEDDIALSLRAMRAPSQSGKTRLMIVPGHDHMLWHHSKEEFAGESLFQNKPRTKGAIAGTQGNRVWIIWTHRFYEDPKKKATANTLYILRLVIENQNDLSSDAQMHRIKAILRAAQAEAAQWGLHSVKLWGPSSEVQALVKRTGLSYKEEYRKDEGICCLRWFGKGSGTPDEIEWVGNEKYGWC